MPTLPKSNPPAPALVKFADKQIEKMFATSQVVDNSGSLPRFAPEELKLGRVLGKGGFGTVWEIKGFSCDEMPLINTTNSTKTPKSSEDTSSTTQENGDTTTDQQQESRKFIAEHCLRQPSGDARYAVKQLSPEVTQDNKGRFLQGMIDMAIETRFLSDIEHPNIIKLRAIANTSNAPYSGDYFLIMDRLYDTLERRIKRTWSNRASRNTGMLRRFSDPKGVKASSLYEERMVAAFDLAAAVDYLHKRGILYRDIKPENIGFDVRDDVKNFDFGLAKELHDDQRNEDGTYNLTEMTGSMRYMAPEVANGQPYNATCDSYSFAILLWQILSLKEPYELYTPKSLRAKVYNGEHKRPPIDDSWSRSIKICLKRSWTQDLKMRNTMSQITTILRKECVRCRDGDDTGLEHDKRRSTFVFRQ